MSTSDGPRARPAWLVPIVVAVVALVALGVFLALRGDGPDEAAPVSTPTPSPTASVSPSPSASPSVTAAERSVPAYFGGSFDDKTRLYREFHRVPVAGSLVDAALAQSLGAPLDPDYRSLWPSGTTATSARSGSSLAVTLSAAPDDPRDIALQQLVWTVTAADPSIRTVDVIYAGGGARALVRAPQLDVLAPVWLLAPTQGATVSSPVTLSGTASVFEATVSWEVLAADGSTVKQGTAMTPEAAPARGPWSVTVTLPPGTYTARAFQASAQDGRALWSDTRDITVR